VKANLTLAFAALLALAPAAWAAAAGVTLTAKIAPVVALPAGQDEVTVPVTLTLANTSDQAVTLESSNRCQTHIWNVTDSKGADVENHSFCTMEYAPQSNPLAAGERQTATEEITLQVANYRSGETYTLHYRFWGIFAEAEFAVKAAK
jgi:hypothetical protein